MHYTTTLIIAALAGISTAAQCNIGSGDAQTNDAKTCADLLRGKAGQSCGVDPNGGSYPPQMCHQGTARVYGLSNNGQAQSASWYVFPPSSLSTDDTSQKRRFN